MKRLLLPVFFVLTLISVSLAQDYGDVSDQELQMTKFDKDPDADGIILYEKAEMRITHDFNLEMHVYRKYKILTERGKKNADVNLYYWHEDEISGISAKSTSPSGEETELDDDNVITTETEGTNSITFHIPGAEIGSVIEYEYDLFSKYITNMEPWYFQHPDYTIESHLNILIPVGFAYNTLTTNFENKTIETKKEKVIDPEDARKTVAEFSFTGRDLPGIKEEPYMDNISDEYAKITFMLQSFRNRYVAYNFAKSWDDLSERYNILYRSFWDTDIESNPDVSAILNGQGDKLDKARMLYSLVNSKIKTEGINYIAGSKFKNPSQVLADKRGSLNEKTILLISLLKKAGMDAKPVLISTVSNGKFNPGFRNNSQFNRILCYLKIRSNEFYLYPGVKFNAFGDLTPETSVEKGLLLEGEKGVIVNINNPAPFSKAKYSTTYSISADGSLKGNTDVSYEGYYAMFERNDICERSTDDLRKFVQDKIARLSKEAVLDTFYYSNRDSISNPLVLHIKFSLPNYLTETGNLVYFKAPLYTDISKNPFIKDTRLYPVDYKFKGVKQEKVCIIIPSNMSITEIPLGTGGSIPGLSFSRLNTKTDTSVVCERSLNIYDRHIPFNKYKILKQIYDKAVSSAKGQVVLAKK